MASKIGRKANLNETDRKKHNVNVGKSIVQAASNKPSDNTMKSLGVGSSGGVDQSKHHQSQVTTGVAQTLLSQLANISKQSIHERRQDFVFPNKAEIEQFHS